MEIKETGIEGLVLIASTIYRDDRGSFMETYHREKLRALGIDREFVQDNLSRSVRGVIRGLHFQRKPHSQAKLIRVSEGVIFDVAVDLRRDSPTFGQWYGAELSSENNLQLMIPWGFAHGFSVISPRATVHYKCDALYHPRAEGGIRFNDPDLAIDWKVDPGKAIVSDKDKELPFFKELEL